MSPNENKNYSKWNQREMSGFVAQELLYDFIKDHLDSSRRMSVEKDISENLVTKKKYQQMLSGISYLEKLRSVEAQATLIQEIDEPSTYLSVLLKKSHFERWPQSVKWGIEAFVVLMGIALFLIVTPWDKALRLVVLPQNQQVILAEIQKDPSGGKVETLADIEKKEKPQFSDDKKDVPQVAATPNKENEAGSKNPTTPKNESSQPLAKNQPTPLKKPMAATPPMASPEATNADSGASDKKIATGGFLYRGQFSVTNVEMIAPKLKEKIIALGGRKAGEVEIGWKKSDSTYYYHFTIPEAKFEEINQYFKSYDNPNMIKEKHPRVMPDGILRLIITVDEKRK
jgi:hypothetical protein